MIVSNMVSNRLVKEIPKFQKILSNAMSRDVNESDTVTVIADIINLVFLVLISILEDYQ